MGQSTKMSWDCSRDGCFNEKCRLKFHVFSECFPGAINFSDVDGIVEIGGRALMLEWKSGHAPIKTGQRIMFERLTKGGLITVAIVHGDAESMSVSDVGVFRRGAEEPCVPCDMQGLKDRIKKWADWASRTKRAAA